MPTNTSPVPVPFNRLVERHADLSPILAEMAGSDALAPDSIREVDVPIRLCGEEELDAAVARVKPENLSRLSLQLSVTGMDLALLRNAVGRRLRRASESVEI